MARKVSLPTFILGLLEVRHNGCDCYFNEYDVRFAKQICCEVTIPPRHRIKLAKAFLRVGMNSNTTIDCADAIKALGGRQLVLDLIKQHATKKYSCRMDRDIATSRLETLDLFTGRP